MFRFGRKVGKVSPCRARSYVLDARTLINIIHPIQPKQPIPIHKINYHPQTTHPHKGHQTKISLDNPFKLQIIEEDNDFAFVWKDCGVLTMDDHKPSLWRGIDQCYGGDGFVPSTLWNIDKVATGIIPFGKHLAAEKHFRSELFHGRVISGVVVGVCVNDAEGNWNPNIPITGKIGGNIIRYSGDKRRFSIVRHGGRPVEVFYHRLASLDIPAELTRQSPNQLKVIPKRSHMVLMKPTTSQQHQIRAVCNSLQMPIVGDSMYGGLNHGVCLYHYGYLSFKKFLDEGMYKIFIPPTHWPKEYTENISIEHIEEGLQQFALPDLPKILPWQTSRTKHKTP